MEPFRHFIPGTKRKPGNAGLSAKEIRDRKRKRLERERELQDDTKQQIVTPSSFSAGEGGVEHLGNSAIDLNREILVSPWTKTEQQRQHLPQNTEGIRQDRHKSPLEEHDLIQNLQNQIESFEQEGKGISENRCRLQKQIHQMEARRTELSMALEKERADLQLEEREYSELETDLAGFEETFRQIKSRREAIEKAKQKKRAELVQLQRIVEEIRDEAITSEKIQNDCITEVETRKKELESERNSFASAIKKASSNISRLRETIEHLKGCNRKEAVAHASTLGTAKHAVASGKQKLNVLLSDNSRQHSSTPKSELKTVFWSPNPEKRKKVKKSTRPLGHGAGRQEKAGNFESESHTEDIVETVDSEPLIAMEVHATPVQHRHSRRASHVDLKSKVDSLSRLGDSRSVNNRKLSSVEKRKEYGKLRKQLIKEVWRTDSLAVSSQENGVHEFSPQSLTYMGHEILRKRRRHFPFAQLDR